MAEHKALYGASITVNAGASDAGTLLLGIEETVQEITPEEARAIAADLIAHAGADTPASTPVWSVVYDEYEDRSTAAVFTRQELAEAHAAQLGSSYSVEAFNVLDRLPKRVTMYGRAGHFLSNGSIGFGCLATYEYWDGQLPPPVRVDSDAEGTRVVTWAATPEEADRLLIDNIAEQLVQRGHAKLVGHWRQHAPDMIRTVQEQGQR